MALPEITPGDPFAYAAAYVNGALFRGTDVVVSNSKVVAEIYATAFRPALELQVAGLAMMQGLRSTGDGLAGAFAFSLVDHLIMGWNSMLVSYARVACTTVRMATESAIFGVATRKLGDQFRTQWEGGRATGGKVLRSLDGKVEALLKLQLQAAWDYTVRFGHPSRSPTVATIRTIVHEGRELGVVSFGGPWTGPLEPSLSLQIGSMYGVVAQITTAAFATTFADELRGHDQWLTAFDRFHDPVAERWRIGLS